MALENMSSQFAGLPMGALIGGPLTAASEAQVQLATATADFIKTVGFETDDTGNITNTRTVSFSFTRPTLGEDGAAGSERVALEVPILAIVKVPSLSIVQVDVTFDMEVKSSETSASSTDTSASVEATASGGWGPFKASVTIKGSVASHKENTRSSDNSAKYHVEVHAKDDGMPEGLARVLDILATSVVPVATAE